MSRIDEALKRSSQGPLPGRGSSHRSTETPLRLAEELTLNEYPIEVRGASHGERAEAAAAGSASPASARKERPFVPGHGVSSQEKLVVVPEPDAVSIEQFRRLAATLHDLQVAKGLKTVMVTSASTGGRSASAGPSRREESFAPQLMLVIHWKGASTRA